jgi:hypothetical protein
MTTDSRAPVIESPMLDGQTETTSWEVAVERLEHPAPGQNHWLATVRPDTRKARNLASDERCVIGTGNLTMPSMDLIIEGRARRVTDEATVRRLAREVGGEGWPLEARGADVYGPHGPTAGPPPYAIYRLEPTTVFGLPGMHGMFDDDRHHAPTRWSFAPG